MFDKDTADQIVKAGIMNALGEGAMERIVDQFLKTLLDRKVNKNGSTEYSNHGGFPNIPWIDYLVGNQLENIVTGCIIQYVNEQRPVIEAQINNKLTMDGAFASKLLDVVLGKLDQGKMDINLNFVPDKD